MKKFSLLIVAVLITVTAAVAQIQNPVKWGVGAKKTEQKDKKESTEAVIFIKATIANGWHIYGLNVPSGGPISTSFTFTPSNDYELIGEVVPAVKPKTKYEEVFKMNVPYFSNEIVFQQRIKLKTTKAFAVKGSVEFMACDVKQCLPPDDYAFSVTIK